MDYKEVINAARKCIGPYCKACPVCNGAACRNTMPGPERREAANSPLGTIRNGRRSVLIWIRFANRKS